jgi:hypothetical protein
LIKHFSKCTHRLCKTAKGFSAFLEPKKYVGEGVAAVVDHEVVIIKVFRSDDVSHGGDDH